MGTGTRGDKTGPVWRLATDRGRGYITPEDVGDAINAGATREEVWRDVLIAVDIKSAEDASLCAFMALNKFDSLSSPGREGKAR
jgi:hypothetical protein